ncbi:hypothetical protein [Streptosporangium sp. NPDC051022]|uniref:hypothetical protein n=1 Tax=Streptosporangium sp. NPDC051022 TaxID=3155752 RepID=UPI00343EE944
MNASSGAGRDVPGTGRGAAWVSEHGAHLMDYATYHLAPGRALPAVASVLTACLAEPAPEGVSARGHLLAALRRDCLTAPGHRERYVPDSGPGMPDEEVTERVWALVDPLDTETLRLMYRHELTVEDLAHALAMPADDAVRLATRTQDLIEILASGLDALANGRRTCPELAPLVETLFPDEFDDDRTVPQGGEDARANLLSHVLKCSVCARPINIRYTVPQMISHPRIRSLTAENRRRLLASLPPEAARPAPKRVKPKTPATAATTATPTAPATATVAVTPEAPTGPTGSTESARSAGSTGGVAPAASPGAPAPAASGPGPASAEEDPSARPVRRTRQDRSTLPYQPVRSDPPERSGRPERPDHPGRSERPDHPEHPASQEPGERPRRPDRSRLPYGPALQDRPTLPSLPVLPAPTGPSLATPASGQDTPLYDALFSQKLAREAATRTGDLTATMPSLPSVPSAAGRAAGGAPGDRRASVSRAYGEPAEAHFGPGLRVLEALAWAGARVKSTTVKIVIIVVAGAAGTLTGMNLFAPAAGTGATGSLRSTASQETAPRETPDEAAPAETPFPEAVSSVAPPRTSPAETTPADPNGLAGRVRIPPVVTLDEFGQGNMMLTVTGGADLRWRITAPGLTVTPSSGTSRAGHPDVIVLRALRIRHWCGTPFQATTPLTVYGPDDSITTTVRWQTC